MKYTCPCCGYKTLDEEPQELMTYVQFVFGKMMAFNGMTLIGKEELIFHSKASPKNFMVFGACEERCMEFVRKPNDKDEKDLNWKQLI